MLPPIVYTAGKFRAPTPDGVRDNIRKAEAVALEVWKRGYACISPHLNTANFDGVLPDSVWLTGDLAILARCDIVLMLDGWEQSVGATAERDYAKRLRLPVVYRADDLPVIRVVTAF